jgi:hypothetical protein
MEEAPQTTAEDPWGTLLTIGKLSLILGVFSLARVGTELVQVLSHGITRGDRTYLLLILCDIPPAILWCWSGRMLRNRTPRALAATVVAGGIALVDGLVSAFTIVPVMIETMSKILHLNHFIVGIFAARLLLYGILIVYSPIAIGMALREYLHPGIPDIYRAVKRRGLWIRFWVTVVLTLPLQIALKWLVMNF